MTRPVLLDVCCCAGGATKGYQQAGFYVVGVDINPQPRYCGDEFHQADALSILRGMRNYDQFNGEAWRRGRYAAIHASPPCQDHSKARMATGRIHGTGWMLAAFRELLDEIGLPWVIENVPGAPMRPDYKLCGCMFGLPGLRRERWFETSWRGFDLRAPCHHIGEAVTVAGHGAQGRQYARGIRHTQADRIAAMGIDWMNRDELAQAIPPAYTEHVGAQLLDHLAAAVTT